MKPGDEVNLVDMARRRIVRCEIVALSASALGLASVKLLEDVEACGWTFQAGTIIETPPSSLEEIS